MDKKFICLLTLLFQIYFYSFAQVTKINLLDYYDIDEDFKVSFARKKSGTHPNIKGSKFFAKNNTSYHIAISDLNNNGIFGDDSDLIHISNSKLKKVHISNVVSNNVTNIKKNMLLEIDNEYYIFNLLDNRIPQISLQRTTKGNNKVDLTFSSFVPDLDLQDFISHKNLNIKNLVQKDEFSIFYFYGSWCTGCIQQIKKIKEFKSNYSCNVKFIYMNFNDDDDKVREYIKENNITNNVFKSNESINKMFSVAMFPTFALYKNGQHILNSISIDEIEKIITITK